MPNAGTQPMNRILIGFTAGIAAAAAFGQAPPGAELEIQVGKNTYPVRVNQSVTVTTPKGEKVPIIVRRRDVLSFSSAEVSFLHPRQLQPTSSTSDGVKTITLEGTDSPLALIQL